MLRAVEHLKARYSAGLALDPGLRKTSITLKAFCDLQAAAQAETMLVIAPLRVCRMVWRQEGAKWTQFKHLKFSLLHGPKKAERLKDKADVFLINPEGIEWLAEQFFGRSLPFDIVTIDELTKFKNPQAGRSKKLRPRLLRVRRRWGLTGSLAPNGYMDLFGQMLILDDGAALGKYITHFRDAYFQVDFNGFDYTLMPGAERRIIEKIAPYWLQMSADDYLELPPLVEDIRELDMEPAARKLYEKMKRDMLAELPEGVVTAANAAATYSKLAQMANGAVYVTPDKATVGVIHDTKLEALEEIVEELDGQPLLVAYEFNHDLERLRERFGTVDEATGKKVLPYLGKGTTATQEAQWIAAWNRNELPVLACHPASAGHGLNLQEGSAAHVCWFGPIWDLELWDQFIRRIRRSGNVAQRIFNHILVVRGTIDELKRDALRDKDTTQSRLLRALNTEILRDAETHADGDSSARETRLQMGIQRLSRQGGAAPATEPQGKVQPKGWSNAAAAPAADDQRSRVQEQLRGPAPVQEETQPVAERARSAFSGGVQATRQALAAQEPEAEEVSQTAAPARRTRSRAPEPAPFADPKPADDFAPVIAARVEVLKLVFGSGDTSLEEGLELARSLMQFVQEG